MKYTDKYKKGLEEERTRLEEELKTVGRINPNNPADWEPVQGETNVDMSDRNEVADGIEQYEENSAILKQLETQYNDVVLALDKIDKGTFGTCEVCGKEIEADRLEANPSARTCKEHIDTTLS